MAFSQLIIIFFNKIKKFVVSFSMLSQLLERKMEQKALGIFFRTNSNNLNGILSYILVIIFIYSKKRKIGK